MSLRIIEVSDDYINYMKSFYSSTMMDNKEGKRKHGRKYIGVVFEINGFKYFAPMSSPKPSDYLGDGTIRKSSRTVLRIIDTITTTPKLLGTLKINNMLPIPDSEIIEYDIASEPDLKYKDLVSDELIWIQRNTTRILAAAKLLYSIKTNEKNNINDGNIKFYQSIMPFKDAEEKCLAYVK